MIDNYIINIEDFEIKEVITSNSFYSDVVLNNKQSQKFFFGRIVKNDTHTNISQNITFLSRINHPTLIKLIGYSPFDFDHQNNPIIITEYYKNGTLESMFESKNQSIQKLNLTNKLKILYGIATGMEYLHAHKTVHCNLQPNTIFLNDDYNPILSNFNYIKSVEYNATEIPEKSIYTAPEVWENNQYTRECDVYSFSLIMYQLLTDQMPFGNLSNLEEIKNKVQDNFRPDFSSSQIPEPLENLIEKCWSQDPEKRPSFDQISYKLQTFKDLIKEELNKEDYNQFIEKIKSSDVAYYEQIIQINSEIIDKNINSELIQQFKKDPLKIKCFIIQEANKIVYDFLLYYRMNKNLNIKFNINEIQKVLIKKFQELAKTKDDDPITNEVMNDIKKIFDEKCNPIIENYPFLLNLQIIDKIITSDNIDQKDKMQLQINELFIDHYQNEFLFNHDKLRDICSSKTNMDEIKNTLKAIKKQYKDKSKKIPLDFTCDTEVEFASFYPLKKSTYSETLLNFLTGNCFIITLFGNPKSTQKVLSSMLKDDVTIVKNKGISIYGPVNFESFAMNDLNSLSFLKYFNDDFPNLFFIEISSKINESEFEDCCHFISYISHFAIFTSESEDTTPDAENFQQLMLSSYFDCLLVNCSTKSSINLSNDATFAAYFDINKLDERNLQNFLIKEIIQNRTKFLPSELIIELSTLILDKNLKMILSQNKEDLRQQIMIKYSNNISKNSSEFFKNLAKKVDQKSTELKKILENLLKITREFYFIHTHIEFWNDPQVERSSKVMILECKNDFESLISYNMLSDEEEDKTKSKKQMIIDEIFSFIKENPLLSDEEYGKYVYDYYLKNKQICESVYFSNLIYNIRKTSLKYLPQDLNVEINTKSFSDSKINVPYQSNNYFMFLTITCHDLYELVKKDFNLESIPFHIKYYHKEMLNDLTALYQLNSTDFNVFYGDYIGTTKSIFDSLDNPKIIQIADDFTIKTNNQNAEYNVTYPEDHDGWFDVAFDIKNANEALEGINDNFLINLKLTENETSYLLEGNAVDLEYHHGNNWVVQNDDVFISFPECDTVIFPLHHCSEYKIVKHKVDIQKVKISKTINDKNINNDYSRNWGDKNPDKMYLRGGRPYYLPVGFESFGIKINNFDENTCVAYHGVDLVNINSIIENGFKLPSELGGPKEGHYKLNATHFEVLNFADAIFVSPSIKYASCYAVNESIIYKNGQALVKSGFVEKDKNTKSVYYKLILLQTRVKPKSFREFPNTINLNIKDPHFPRNVLEWRIENPKDVFPYRILYKFIEANDFFNDYILKTQEDYSSYIETFTSEMIKKLLMNNGLIKEGASSTVYIVNNCFTNYGYLALKILNNDIFLMHGDKKRSIFTRSKFDKDNKNVKELFKESEKLSNLGHPNIVKVFGFFYGDKNTNPAILLEYYRSNLEEGIKSFDCFDQVTAIYEICSVMKYIHDREIVYCNLTPKNILIDDDKHIKLCDFSISKVIDIENLLKISHDIGSPHLMAPEIFDLSYQYDEKVDVYAFGVVMYFILTMGKYPALKLGNPSLVFLKLPNQINELSQNILKKCWSDSPEKRPIFTDIIDIIVNNNFLLIDGIEDKVPEIRQFLGLEQK